MPLMATYRVRRTGQIIERFFRSLRKAPRRLTPRNDPDRKLKAGDVADFAPFAPRPTPRRAPYPIVSLSMGVSPEDIPAARQKLGCDFTPDGKAIYENRSHKLAVLKRAGWRERS